MERKGHDLARLEFLISKRFGSGAGETLKLIGMGIEFLFQKAVLPELNVWTKLRAGGFKAVCFNSSRSRQAEIAEQWLGPIFPILHEAWEQLTKEAVGCPADALPSPNGTVVFPGSILNDILTGIL